MIAIIEYIQKLILGKSNNFEIKTKIKNNFTVYLIVCFLEIITLIASIFLNINLISLSLILTILAIISYSVAIKNSTRRKFLFLDLTLFYLVISNLLFTTLNKIACSFSTGMLLTVLKVFIILMIYMGLILSRLNKNKSEFYKIYGSASGNISNEKKSGDHVIGIDIENRNDIKIPLHDRYVHTLIIGSTGTGKSSQILLPMINADLQNHDMGSIIIEPKGDLAEKSYQLALHYGRKALYFNPMIKNAPYFNPLYGNEDDVIENLATAFRMLDPDSSMFFQNQAENLVRKALKVLKRLYGNDATLIDLNTLLWNTDNEGRKILVEFYKKVKPNSMKAENEELYQWFMGDYFTGSTGEKNSTKTYEHTSGIRTQVAKLVSNKYLRKVLNPPKGVGTDIDFIRALANCEVICITTAQGDLQALSSYLGYFLILQLQAAVFKRSGDEKTRKPCILTVDEFQEFANPGFSKMLTQGRSYRTACVLATQNLALIGMNSGRQGKDFSELVKTNARNLIVFPGCNYQDADYFSKLFGEDYIQIERVTKSRQIYNPFMSWNLKAPSESVSVSEERRPRFSPTEIINMQFTEVLCRLINNNSVMPARKCKVSFIDKELNDKMDELVYAYREENTIDKTEEEERAQTPDIFEDDYKNSNNNNKKEIKKDDIDIEIDMDDDI